METIKEIREYNFSEHDTSKVKDTKDNILKLMEDVSEVWQEWSSYSNNNENALNLEIDFDFYSANKELSKKFLISAENENFKVVLKSIRTMIIFKGYEIRLSKRQPWTLQKLKEELERLGLIGRKYYCLIEGYGALVK